MNGLNISLINNHDDALRYINPVTEAEAVLHDLLKDAVVKINDLEENCIEELEEENEDLREENKALYSFFSQIVDAYNNKLGINRAYAYDNEFLIDEIVDIIKNSA